MKESLLVEGKGDQGIGCERIGCEGMGKGKGMEERREDLRLW